MQRPPLDIHRAVSFLLRKHGCYGVGVALERAELCARRDDVAGTREWTNVAAHLRDLLAAKSSGFLH